MRAEAAEVVGEATESAAPHVELDRRAKTPNDDGIRIKAVLDRIAEHSPALAKHFEATLRTGTFCSYVPDPRAPLRWEL